MSKDEESNVSDLKPEGSKGSTSEQPKQVNAPTSHWAMPISLMQDVIEYLRKQPMEEVERLVSAIKQTAVPVSVTPKESEG